MIRIRHPSKVVFVELDGVFDTGEGELSSSLEHTQIIDLS